MAYAFQNVQWHEQVGQLSVIAGTSKWSNQTHNQTENLKKKHTFI